MQQTSKPFEPHSHSGTAVENGMDVSNSEPAIDHHDKVDVVELLLVLARKKKPILLFSAGGGDRGNDHRAAAAQDVYGNQHDSASSAKAIGAELDAGTDGSHRGAERGRSGLEEPGRRFCSHADQPDDRRPSHQSFRSAKRLWGVAVPGRAKKVESKQRDHRYERGADFHFRYRP